MMESQGKATICTGKESLGSHQHPKISTAMQMRLERRAERNEEELLSVGE